ncbi:MAG: hypothetical protein GY793_00980 [Proteobacteria bacterium]|nr:hypothetical protein [Pseudomonadota bacterium]
MKTFLISLLTAMLATSSVKAVISGITCKNIDNTKTYQGLCIHGSIFDIDCNKYVMIEGFGKIPYIGPFISKVPYFVKTPEMKIEDIVSCRTFSAFVDNPDVPIKHLEYQKFNTSGKFKYENSYENFHREKGKLSIDFFRMSARGSSQKQFSKETMQKLIRDIKQFTSAVIHDVSETGTAIVLKNISVQESLLLRHRYSSDLYDFQWIDNEKIILIK